MARKASFEAVVLLQIAVGLFLATLGIAGIAAYNSDLNELGRAVNSFFGGRNDPTAIVVSIVELVAGIAIIAALFVPIKGKLLSWITLLVTVLWLLYLLATAVSSASERGAVVVVWLNQLALHLIVLVSLWMVNRRYA